MTGLAGIHRYSQSIPTVFAKDSRNATELIKNKSSTEVRIWAARQLSAQFQTKPHTANLSGANAS
jgi:hypothetical protein